MTANRDRAKVTPSHWKLAGGCSTFGLLFARARAREHLLPGKAEKPEIRFASAPLLLNVKIVIAPDSFKGSLSAAQVACAVAQGIHELHPEWQTLEVPIADGGEGTVDAVLRLRIADCGSRNGEWGSRVADRRSQNAKPETGGLQCARRVSVTVKSPLLTDVAADFAVLDDEETAVIEMAQASGLTLAPENQRNPLLTTTFGTGELVRRAIEEGCSRIYIGIGGSATVDGGAGMAAALGVRFLDADGKEIPLGGGGLAHLKRIDLSGRIGLSGLQITALSDVTNPLLGRNGAARVFSPQKGATREMVGILERNLARFARIIKRDLGVDVAEIPGAGAAGGLGAGILAFLNGEIKSGVATLIDLIGLREKIGGADLVITGEGKLDFQSLGGKAPVGVAEAASELGVPVIAICGSLGEGAAEVAGDHFMAALSLAEIAGSQEQAMLRPRETLKRAVALFLTMFPPPWAKASPLARRQLFGRTNNLTASSHPSRRT